MCKKGVEADFSIYPEKHLITNAETISKFAGEKAMDWSVEAVYLGRSISFEDWSTKDINRSMVTNI